MFNLVTSEEVLKEFCNNVEAGFEANPVYNTIEDDMKTGGANLRTLIRSIRANVIANIPDGIPVPQAVLYITPIGDDAVKMITITLSNKAGGKEFKYSISVMGSDIAKKISTFFVNVYDYLIKDWMVESNLELVNEFYQKVTEEAGVPYAIKFVSPLGMGGKKIASLTDAEIVFVAEEREALSIDQRAIFSEDEDYAKLAKKATSVITADIANSQTTVELVKNYGDDFIRDLCGIKTRVRPATYIKGVYSKNIQRVQGSKDVIGYFQDGDIFSVVSRTDGGYEVLLSPVNLKTFKKEDYDVLAAVMEE